MTTAAAQIIRFLFTEVWRLFTSWHIPGTNFTPAAMLFTPLFIALILKFVSRLFVKIRQDIKPTAKSEEGE